MSLDRSWEHGYDKGMNDGYDDLDYDPVNGAIDPAKEEDYRSGYQAGFADGHRQRGREEDR